MVFMIVSAVIIVIGVIIAIMVTASIYQRRLPVRLAEQFLVDAVRQAAMGRHPAGKQRIPHKWNETTRTWACLRCGKRDRPNPCDCPCHAEIG